MDTGLAQKNVLVTGTSGGIGGEVARAFLREGARVIAHYHTGQDRVVRQLERCAGQWVALQADLTQENQVRQLFEDAHRLIGPVEILVANAGYWPPQDVALVDMTLEQWQRTIAVNLTGTFLCLREFIAGIRRHRLEQPSAVLIGSTAGLFGEAGHADYASAKAALAFGLARSAKNEIVRLARHGRVNVVCPGWTLTPMVRDYAAHPERFRRVLQTMPLRKVARPSDVAAAVVFLASPKLSGHITGQILTVAGGMEGRVLFEPEEIDLSEA